MLQIPGLATQSDLVELFAKHRQVEVDVALHNRSLSWRLLPATQPSVPISMHSKERKN